MPLAFTKECEKFEERKQNYRKFHTPAVWLVVVGVFLPVALLLYSGKEGDFNFFEFRLAALITFVCLIVAAFFVGKHGKKYKLNPLEELALLSYKSTKHLSSYVESDLEKHRKNAKKVMEELASRMGSQWDISQPVKPEKMKNLDGYLSLNKIRQIIDVACIPILEEGDLSTISETLPFFEKLTALFMKSDDNLIKEVLESSTVFLSKTPDSAPSAESSQSKKSFRTHFNSPRMKHAIFFSVAAIVSLVTIIVLVQFMKAEVLGSITLGCTLGLGLAGVYGTFIRKGH